MAGTKRRAVGGDSEGPVGFLGGLGSLIEKLTELAEKGEELKGLKEFGDASGVHGVYGFTIKSGLGSNREGVGGGVKVEPFGNVRKDSKTGRVKVHEVIEPLIDIFDEADHTLVVAELPGIAEGDVRLELHEDILTIDAERSSKKYHKEVLLPSPCTAEKMTSSCHNGVLEVRLTK